MSTFISVVLCIEKMQPGLGASPGRGLGKQSPTEAETISFWTCNGSRKFACFLNIWKRKTSHISAVLQK